MTDEEWGKVPEYEDAAVFDALKEPIYITDADTYELLFVNKTAKEKLGLTGVDCSGMKCHKVLRGKERPCEDCFMSSLTLDNCFSQEVYQPVMQEHCHLNSTLLRYKGRRACVEICVNIDSVMEQRRLMEMALEAEAVLNDAIHELYICADVEDTIGDVLGLVAQKLQATRSYLVKLSDGKLFMEQEWHAAGVPSLFDRVQGADAEMVGRWLEILREHESVIVSDLKEIKDMYPMEYDLLMVQNIRSYAVMPVFMGQDLYGYINFENIKPMQLNASKRMLSTLAYFVGASLVAAQNRRLMVEASYTDAMTGVANRNAYTRDLEAFDKRNDHAGMKAGVIFLDLNGLKRINDELGHREGDKVITALAENLSLFFRKQEIYRTGGDEFVIVCIGIPERLFLDRMTQSLRYLQRQTNLSVSVGHSFSNDLSRLTLRQIIARADEMMYTEKKSYYETNGKR